MKKIEPFTNEPIKVHVAEIPTLNSPSLQFAYKPGKHNDIATLKLNIKLLVKGVDDNKTEIATYVCTYKVSGEGLVIDDHIYKCLEHATHSMKVLLQFDKIGRSIPQQFFQCPEREVFEDDLTFLAKHLNAIDGKRPFP